MPITHAFVNLHPDGPDVTVTRPSDWNAQHIGTATPALHNVLDSVYHSDVLTGAITRGDLLYGNATPKIARLALGGISGSIVTRDATDVLWSSYALAGTLGAIYTFPTVSGNVALGAGTLTNATANDATIANHTHAVTGTFPASTHDILSASHGDTLAAAVVRGSLIYGNATPKWASLGIGGITGSVVTRNATDVIWSGYALSGTAGGTTNFAVTNTKTLTLTAADSYNITMPATGTVAIATGIAGGQTLYGGTAANDDLHLIGTSNATKATSYVTLQSTGGNVGIGTAAPSTLLHMVGTLANAPILRLEAPNIVGGAGVAPDLQFYDTSAVLGFRFLAAFGNPAGFRYGGFIAYSDRDGFRLPLAFISTDAGGTLRDGIFLGAGQTAGSTPVVGVGRGVIVGAATVTYQLDVQQISALTNTLGSTFRLAHNTTNAGHASNGFGAAFDWYLESSTTDDQQAYRQFVKWTDSTHASRTALYVGETYPAGSAIGHHGFWSYSGVAGTALTVIPNATGDVTEALTAVYVVSAITGGDASGGTCTLEPSDSFNLYSDGTDTLALAVAADGSVTVQRTAGADTFKVSLWLVWQ